MGVARTDDTQLKAPAMCWQAGADGSLRCAPDEQLTPFVVLPHVRRDEPHHCERVTTWADPCSRLVELRPRNNLFMALRVLGLLDRNEVHPVSAVETGTELDASGARLALRQSRDFFAADLSHDPSQTLANARSKHV